MAIQRIFFLTAIMICFCFTHSFSVAGERPISINFWPLFHYLSDPIEGTEEIEGLGPFFHWKREPHRKQWGIRPLLYWTGEDNESLWRLEYVYPFGKYEFKEGEGKGYLFPLSLFKEETLDGKKKWDFQFFPFFIGETEEGEDYWGLFPIYGFLLNRYGKDEIRFYFWPLYSRSTSGGVRKTNLLWPFFSIIEGDKKKGFSLWPFYGRKEEFGISKGEFLLWPIFFRKTQGLDTEDPTEEKGIFPLYLSKESRHFESKTFLWPFFSHARDRLTGFEQWDLPWPFFQTIKGEDLYVMRIFPLYGYKEQGKDLKRIYVLYPLYQLEEDRVREVEERTHRILLLNRIRTGENQQGVKEENSIRIWPFFNYEREKTGHEKLAFFYLFPFIDDGFERNLFPIFRVFRQEKDPQRGRTTNLLWGFYQRIKKEDLDFWEVAHLMGVKKGNGWKTVFLLKGLFWYKSDGINAEVRLFYLPFHLRWSHHHSPSAKGREGDRLVQNREEMMNLMKKELADGQEDWDIGDGFIFTGKGPDQF
jgi:hypothetical protein